MIQRRPHQPVFPVAPASIRQAASRGPEREHHGPDRRFAELAMDGLYNSKLISTDARSNPSRAARAGAAVMDQLKDLARLDADPQPWQMGKSPDSFRADGSMTRSHPASTVRIMATSGEHNRNSGPSGPAFSFCRHRQRLEYHLDLSGPRYRLRLALVSGAAMDGLVQRIVPRNKPIACAAPLSVRADVKPYLKSAALDS